MTRLALAAIACVMLALAPSASMAEANFGPAAGLGLAAPAPPPVDRVGYAAPHGARLPGNARFTDTRGRAVTLSDYFGQRPLLVVLGYYGCSNLCSYVLQGLRQGLDAAGLRPGRDVEVVAVSIAPLETPALARRRMREVLGTDHADGWHFLTGHDAAIAAVTGALGFRYTYDAAGAQYAHAAGVTLASADGRIVAMLPGVAFARDTLRARLREAAAPAPAGGAAAMPRATQVSLDVTEAPQRWLLCFHYDPHTGRYSFAAMSAVRVVALAVLAALVGYACRAWLRERRRTRAVGPRR
jgi:protein SCO1/2